MKELSANVKDSLSGLGSLGPLSLDSEALKIICENSIKISNKLLAHLEDLQANLNHKLLK
jgi:hypothetical protein